MIPNYNNRQVDSQGVTDSHEFGISMDDAAHIMTILRDTLYSDKVLAVLREYGSNAWDAHREAGKGDVPIKIVLPTVMDPVLTIRDFGTGLSHESMFRVFTKYGASTKRNSDSMVGMLGIGSKSGFAYSDNFTITSWNGGMRRIYAAVLDATEKGTLNLLDEEACDVEETGLQIQIPIRAEDIWEFTQKAEGLFKYFSPMPDINTTLSIDKDCVVLNNGYLSERLSSWVAVMGCVPYLIDPNQLTNKDVSLVGDYVKKLGGALFFDIGDVQISASRESLKYNDSTKKALAAKFEAIAEEYVVKTIREIQALQLQPWQMRLRAQLMNKLALPIPDDLLALVKATLQFPESDVYTIYRNGHTTHKVDVHVDTRIIIKNDERDMAGYNLYGHFYIVKPVVYGADEEAKAALDEDVKKLNAEGIPICFISSLPWTSPKAKKGKAKSINKKHHVKSFKLVEKPVFYSPYSRDWEIVSREPTPEDLFVFISGFKVVDGDFVRRLKNDKALTEALGVPMPSIYAYKRKKGQLEEQTIGTPYKTWSESLLDSLLTDENLKILNAIRWDRGNRLWRVGAKDRKNTRPLGKDHVINRIVSKWKESKKFLETLDSKLTNRGNIVFERVEEKIQFEADIAFEEVRTKYPLLRRHGYGLDVFWDKDSYKDWVQYVQAVDLLLKNSAQIQEPEDAAEVHDNE